MLGTRTGTRNLGYFRLLDRWLGGLNGRRKRLHARRQQIAIITATLVGGTRNGARNGTRDLLEKLIYSAVVAPCVQLQLHPWPS